MPSHAAGMKKGKAFWLAGLSGGGKPTALGLTILLLLLLVPVLPYLLAFAAGAMLVVVAQELLPQACGQETPQRGAVRFTLGFLVMMVLDVVLQKGRDLRKPGPFWYTEKRMGTGGRTVKTNCEYCRNYAYDEEWDCYVCQVNLDELMGPFFIVPGV